MRAVVLVGGFGTRLRPLTLSIPKPMLAVGHVPIIERLITNLAAGGVTEATLALGFKAEPFIHAFPGGTCAGVTLRYAVEPAPRDTAGAIAFAADFSDIDDTFVVANGDILTDLDVAAMAAFHRATGAEATIHVIPVDDPASFGVVDVDDDARVSRFVEKPAPGEAPSNLINAGTYILERSVLDRIPRGRKVSIERVTFPAIADGGRLFAYATDDYWIDTGRPELYLQANLDLLTGLRPHGCAGVHPDATVHVTAEIVDSIIAAGASVGEGAVIRRSVVFSGAVIGPRASVSDSSVMGHVGAGALIEHVVLGADAHIDADDNVRYERRPDPDAT